MVYVVMHRLGVAGHSPNRDRGRVRVAQALGWSHRRPHLGAAGGPAKGERQAGHLGTLRRAGWLPFLYVGLTWSKFV